MPTIPRVYSCCEQNCTPPPINDKLIISPSFLYLQCPSQTWLLVDAQKLAGKWMNEIFRRHLESWAFTWGEITEGIKILCHCFCIGVETWLPFLPVFIFFKFIALTYIELILSYNLQSASLATFHSVVCTVLVEGLGKEACVLNSLDSHVTFMVSTVLPGPRQAWWDLGSRQELALGGISQLVGFAGWKWLLVGMPINVGKRSVLREPTWEQQTRNQEGDGPCTQGWSETQIPTGASGWYDSQRILHLNRTGLAF